MTLDLFAPGAGVAPNPKPPPGGGVELAGKRQWVRSLLVLPVLFLLVVAVCALAGLDDLNSWLVVLVVMSALTVVFEALLVRNGAPSLVVSPGAVVRRAGWRTITVRAEDVSDVMVRPAINGPVMIISTGSTKVGVPLPSAYRKPLARAALASFLRHAGVDLPSLRGLGLPVPVKPSRAVAGPILSRPGGVGGPAEGPAGEGGGSSERSSGRSGTPLGVPVRDVADPGASGYRPASVRVTGRAMAWVTLAAFCLTAAIGLLRLFY
jgi:hypothetical protein